MVVHRNPRPLQHVRYSSSTIALASGLGLPLGSLLAVALLIALFPDDRLPLATDAMASPWVRSDSQFQFASVHHHNWPDQHAPCTIDDMDYESDRRRTSIHVKGCVVGHLKDVAAASTDNPLTVVHAFEFLVHGTTEYGDRNGVAQEFYFERIWEVSLLTSHELMPIQVGRPAEPLLDTLWTPTPHVGQRRVSSLPLIQAFSGLDVSTPHSERREQALWSVSSLSGKTVRLSWNTTEGTTSLAPLNCELSKTDTDWLRRTTLPALLGSLATDSLASDSANQFSVTAASLSRIMPINMRFRRQVHLLGSRLDLETRDSVSGNQPAQNSPIPTGSQTSVDPQTSIESGGTAWRLTDYSKTEWEEDSDILKTLYPANVLLDSKFVLRGKAHASLIFSRSACRNLKAEPVTVEP